MRWTDPADVPRIAAGLRQAQREWEARGAKGRAKVLARYAVWMGEHRDEIESLLIKETGKSATDAAQEVPLLIMIASYYIKTMEKALAPEARPASLPFLSIKKVTVHYRPRPVVGIIAPWNYPVANLLMDGIAALAAGCAVLLKPSERTPLTAELLLRGWTDSGAPEVMAIVQGAREAVEAVVDNSDYIQFTGSSATGAKVMERAARRLTPVSLELGGKDPMIVLEDADVDLAAHAAVWGAMFNAGQTCVSVERVYVLEQVYDQFVDAVVRDVQEPEDGRGGGLRLRRADRRRPGGRHRTARRRRARQGRQGAHRRQAPVGARQLLRAHRARRRRPLDGLHDGGDVRPDAADHEGVDASPRRCGWPTTARTGSARRCSPKDIERANDVALELDCGAVNINDVISNLMCTTAPMGGWKTSGIGARFGGADGLRKFCRQEAVVAPRTNVGAGGNYYNNSLKAMKRMNTMMTKFALIRPKRVAK